VIEKTICISTRRMLMLLLIKGLARAALEKFATTLVEQRYQITAPQTAA
jgi:hypothetical protein